MRKSYSQQSRLDCSAVGQVVLNVECRDEMIPILAALQYIYSQRALRDEVLRLIADDVNPDSCADRGREGLDYWCILVLAAVRLGCNFNYDRLQDLAENHRTLRHVMGIGDWDDETSFKWQRIRDNLCLVKPDTIARISQLIVQAGQDLHPESASTCRVDSFVVETNIHYPTECSLLWDGLRTIIKLCVLVSLDLDLPGWRQHAHLRKSVKKLYQAIARISASKKPASQKKRKKLYAKLLKRTQGILKRAEKLLDMAHATDLTNVGRIEQIRVFVARTRQVASTAYRRVIVGQRVPNQDKLFSMFEPHTQLYRRGKARQENQFGRLVLICEDGAGFITHHYLMDRQAQDADVVVPQITIVQEKLHGAIDTLSLDRGFYSPDNERELEKRVAYPCLPQRGATAYNEQMKQASVQFRAARQRHPGVESAIGALQSGNGLKRCRDRTEIGFERYLCLAILGRNLHVLGKLLIARQAPNSEAAQSRRKQAV